MKKDPWGGHCSFIVVLSLLYRRKMNVLQTLTLHPLGEQFPFFINIELFTQSLHSYAFLLQHEMIHALLFVTQNNKVGFYNTFALAQCVCITQCWAISSYPCILKYKFHSFSLHTYARNLPLQQYGTSLIIRAWTTSYTIQF